MSRAAGILYEADGKYLLVLRAGGDHTGTWAFPGGKIEPGETPEQAAKRESFEEVGYMPAGKLEFLSDDGNFTAYKIRGEYFTPVLNSEHTSYVWAAPDELPEPLHPGVYESIKGRSVSKRVADLNGFIEVRGNPISKAGVFPYSGRAVGGDPDKVYMVYRPAEELNNPDTIESFKLAPFVDDHPSDMLGSSDMDLPNVDGKPIEGVIGEQVYFQDGYLYGNLKLYSDRVRNALNAGKREVSAGFRCRYDYEPGVFEGQPYDYVQRSIRGNHLALVEQGRMGPEVAVLDHFTMTFDSKELLKMADPQEVKKEEGATDAEPAGTAMTLEDVTKVLKEIGPQVAKLTEAMAALGAPADKEPDGDEVVLDADTNKEPAAAGMDAKELAAQVTKLTAQVAKLTAAKGMDAKDVFAAATRRDALANQVSVVIGSFDHSAMDEQDVAKYAVTKLGLQNVPAGSEIVAVNAFLQAKPVRQSSIIGMDAKTGANPVDAYLSGPAK